MSDKFNLTVPNEHAEAHVPVGRDDWLELRNKDVTASDIGSLFGIGRSSKYQMWMEKAKKESVVFEDNTRMFWGRKLERAIAEGICEEMGWKLHDLPVAYFRDPRFNLGATPDFFVECPKRGMGLLQIKNVDFLVFKNSWTPAKDNGEAPDYIEAQLQCELGVTGYKWGAIGALVSGNDHHVYIRDAYEDVIKSMQTECSNFWESIKTDTPPSMDYISDSEFIIKINSQTTSGKIEDMSGDPELAELINKYEAAKNDEANAKEAKDAIKARIFVIAGDAEKVVVDGAKLNVGRTKDSPGTLITEEMVGTHVGARKGYRQMRITLAK